MSLDGVLGKVGSQQSGPMPVTVGSETFRMYMRKEIDFKTYVEMNAVAIAKEAHRIRPRLFPAMPGALRAYCQERIQQRRDYDVQAGNRLGVWVWRCIRTSEENSADSSLLLWAKEKLIPTGLQVEIETIEEALTEFAKVTAPHADMLDAVGAQKVDAIARDKTK